MLSYAGVPLTVPTSEQQESIQAWMDSWTEEEFSGRTWPGPGLEGMTFAQSNWPPDHPQLGTLYWPFTAMKWAVGHFVCSGEQLELIRASLPPISSVSPPQPAPLVMNTGGAFQTITPELFMLPPRPIHQIPGANQFYLLTLVDERYHWWFKDVGVFHIIPGSTWVDLYSAIALALGVVVNADVVSANYFFPDPAWTSYYQPLPVLFDAIAYNCGHRVVRALDGTVSTVLNASSLALLNQNILEINNGASKILGGSFQRANDFAQSMPAAVHNVTPIWSSRVPTVLSPLHHVETRTLSGNGLGAITGFDGYKTFNDTFHGTASAFAGEILLATQVALDYYSRQWNGFLDVTLCHPLNLAQDGLHDFEWSYTIERTSTRIKRPTWNWEPDTLLHGDGNGPFYGNSSNEPWRIEPFFAQITSSPTGTAYPWKEIIPQTGGAWADKPDNQRTGAAALDPAYELNGSTTVANGTIVIMWRGFQNAAATKQEWLFMVAGSGGGGTTITVQESDGSPICTGISVIKADSSTMIVTCNGDGSATITVKNHSQTVVTDITSIVCNDDGTITANFTTASVNVVG